MNLRENDVIPNYFTLILHPLTKFIAIILGVLYPIISRYVVPISDNFL